MRIQNFFLSPSYRIDNIQILFVGSLCHQQLLSQEVRSIGWPLLFTQLLVHRTQRSTVVGSSTSSGLTSATAATITSRERLCVLVVVVDDILIDRVQGSTVAAPKVAISCASFRAR